MMAFLQRVINGGGTLQREYALGTRRVDILLRWRSQTIVIELKLLHSERQVTDGVKLIAYMDNSGASEGHLIIFDRDPNQPWEKKIYHRERTHNAKIIHSGDARLILVEELFVPVCVPAPVPDISQRFL